MHAGVETPHVCVPRKMMGNDHGAETTRSPIRLRSIPAKVRSHVIRTLEEKQ